MFQLQTMVSDSIVNASIPNGSKDLGKKKRANRSAKLKQCKLDARREQWLSQVKNKVCKAEVNGNGGGGGGGGELDGTTIGSREKGGCCKDLELGRQVVEEIHHYSDSESSPTNSPTSSLSGGNDSGNSYKGSSSSSASSSSSFSSVGCCSGSITEEEEGGGRDGDEGCLDDWEAVADALAADVTDEKQGHNPGADPSHEKESEFGLDSAVQLACHRNVDGQAGKLKPDSAGTLGKASVNGKAWRPDDAFRPQSLPNLSKQRSFPVSSERLTCHAVNPWVRENVPSSCPICCEDLDLTDSTFLPCSCGFRLCLFCHKRILEDDGRCPGCRKAYSSTPVERETSVTGGSLTVRLMRSCSMFSRV